MSLKKIGSLLDRENLGNVNDNFNILDNNNNRANNALKDYNLELIKMKSESANFVSKSEQILNEANLTNKENLAVQKQIDDLILSEGDSSVEVTQARNGKDTLNDRLNIMGEGIGVNILDFPRLEGEIDDRNRFQRAIDHLSSIGGGKLIIPKTPNDYELIAPEDVTIQNPYRVKIETSNIEIEGVGFPTILMKGLTHSYLDSIDDLSSSGRDVFTAFSFIGVENCKVSGLKIIGEWDGVGEFRYASPRSIGVGFKGGKNCHVENVHGEYILGNVVNFTGAMVAVEGFYKWSENISIINSYAYKNLENGFNFMGTTRDGKFINNHSIGNGSAGFESATENLVVSDNISKSNKYSGFSISGVNYLLSNNVISDNTSKNELVNKKANGIQLTGGNNGEIINNRVSNSEGFELYVYPGINGIRIKNNTFTHNDTSNAQRVIYLSGTLEKKIIDFEISGNKINNTSTSISETILFNYSANGVITNNIITANFGLRTIYVQGNCSNITLDSNIVDKEIVLSNSGIDLISRDNLGSGLVKRVELPNEPTSGKWERGDIVDNTSKFIGQGHPDRWRCVLSGYANNNPWKSNTNYQSDVLINNAGKVYKSKKTGSSSNTPPTHVTGSQTDGTQEWEFVSDLAIFEVAGQVGLYQSSTTKPLFKGQLSQSGSKIFISIGNSSSADWVQLSNN